MPISGNPSPPYSVPYIIRQAYGLDFNLTIILCLQVPLLHFLVLASHDVSSHCSYAFHIYSLLGSFLRLSLMEMRGGLSLNTIQTSFIYPRV